MDREKYEELKAEAIKELEALKAEGENVDNLLEYIKANTYDDLMTTVDPELVPYGALD
jgi:hypothetical protein